MTRMKAKQRVFWRSVYPLVGSVIGVGIFGLPFAFGQAGFGIGVIHLVVLGLVNTFMLLIYADIVMNTDGHPRLTGIVERYLGKGWSHVATVLMIGSIWGAMLAYIIVGGEFLHALLAPVLGGALMTYQVVFFFVSAVLLIGGLGFISRLQVVFVLTLLVMLFLILVGALPFVSLENLTYVDQKNAFLPFGVVLFAFGGFAAIPEMAQVLGRQKKMLRKSILVGVSLVAVVYLAFAGVVVAVTGPGTTEEAIIGLGGFVGNWVLVIGSIVGLFSVFTSFLILGIAATDTFVYDYKVRYFVGWLGAILVPFAVYLLGARSFIGVVGFIGGVFGPLTSLLLVYTYVKAKTHVCTPKRCLRFPSWVLYVSCLVYLVGGVATVLGL